MKTNTIVFEKYYNKGNYEFSIMAVNDYGRVSRAITRLTSLDTLLKFLEDNYSVGMSVIIKNNS